MTNKQAQELLIQNGQLVADTLRHLADNEIDSDYFAITSTSENGTETECELVITEYARHAAGTVDELVKALEAKDAQLANLAAERDALREGEMGDAQHSNTRAAADIYFQLVEECEISAGGSLVEHIDNMRYELEAAEKRIAEFDQRIRRQNRHACEMFDEAMAQRQRVAELEAREVKLPLFDGYVPHIGKELQAAFRIACADAGIRINGEG
ncbi:Uncharacterised protein [Enterobacter hormaechei]|uniref:hypothetical protein n=1 Tax=Enterobacter hormaechei TaxID=158836 RepID=UPI00079851D1|nr:hypothetical protein [Enterobacter hormaechei]CZW77201.1 Uncharacterised protein [Enterobacter hormaechei]CZY09293.1 Uncharacterised protein [Enterobacter hormaechei]